MGRAAPRRSPDEPHHGRSRGLERFGGRRPPRQEKELDGTEDAPLTDSDSES